MAAQPNKDKDIQKQMLNEIEENSNNLETGENKLIHESKNEKIKVNNFLDRSNLAKTMQNKKDKFKIFQTIKS